MHLEDRIGTLRVQHHELEQALADQSNRPLPDDVQIASLKKQKLAIKDRMATLDS